MKMAKASKEEVDRALKLVRLLDSTIDTRSFDTPRFLPDEDDEDDEGERFNEDDSDDLRKLVEQIRALCPGLMRVVFGFQVLLDNCCDPDADTLEMKPELKKLMNTVTIDGQTYTEADLRALVADRDQWQAEAERLRGEESNSHAAIVLLATENAAKATTEALAELHEAMEPRVDPFAGKCEKHGTDAYRCLLVDGHDGKCDRVPF